VIIDCHTHWGMVWQERDADDPTRWLSCLDQHGVDRALVFGYANLHRLDWCQRDNDTLCRLAARSPGRILAVGTTWLQMEAEAVAEARRCIDDLGMKALKFHPWLQGASVVHPAMDEICAFAGQREVPIIFHDGTPCYSLTEQIAGLARRFPATRFVLGHSGLLWNWRSALLAARLPNVWICLCGPHQRAMELLCQAADPERILWGSDYGVGFSDPIDYRLNLLRRARLSDELRERILGANALRLLGLPQ
jgi:uncharacterized protein